jgi:outer membrane protein assembly factor BamB
MGWPKDTRGYLLGWTGLVLGVSLITGCSEASEPIGPPGGGDEGLEPLWIQEISHRALARPLRADDQRVFVSTRNGVSALDQTTGAPLWQTVQAPGLIGFPYVLAKEVVVVARADELVGVHESDGREVWSHRFPFIEAFVATDDRVYVTEETFLNSLDALDGSPLWNVPFEPGGQASLAAGNELVCVERLVSPPDISRLSCYGVLDGSLVWSQFMTPPRAIAVSSNRIVAMGTDSRLTALDPATGEVVWERVDLPAGELGLSRSGEIIFLCRSECLAVQADDGQLIWRTSMEEEVEALALGGDYLFTVATEGPLFVLDARTGNLRARIESSSSDQGKFCGTPAANGALVFVLSCFGNLYAYRIL